MGLKTLVNLYLKMKNRAYVHIIVMVIVGNKTDLEE